MNGQTELSQRQILEVYSEVLRSIWRKAVSMLGPVALQTMIEAALFDAAGEYHFLEYIEVTDEGVRFPEDVSVFDEVPPERLKEAFKTLFTRLFSNVSTLTGQVVVKHLRPDVEQAEQRLGGD